MATDWNLIRDLISAALEACEQADKLAITDHERAATIDIAGNQISVWDILQTSWTYPENLRDSVVRARHKLGEDRTHVTEVQRTLANVGVLAGELIGLSDLSKPVSGTDPHSPEASQSVRESVERLVQFYRGHMNPNLMTAVTNARRRR